MPREWVRRRPGCRPAAASAPSRTARRWPPRLLPRGRVGPVAPLPGTSSRPIDSRRRPLPALGDRRVPFPADRERVAEFAAGQAAERPVAEFFVRSYGGRKMLHRAGRVAGGQRADARVRSTDPRQTTAKEVSAVSSAYGRSFADHCAASARSPSNRAVSLTTHRPRARSTPAVVVVPRGWYAARQRPGAGRVPGRGKHQRRHRRVPGVRSSDEDCRSATSPASSPARPCSHRTSAAGCRTSPARPDPSGDPAARHGWDAARQARSGRPGAAA